MVVTTLYIVVGLLLSTLVQMSSSYCMMTAPKERKYIYVGYVPKTGLINKQKYIFKKKGDLSLKI